MDDTTPDTLRGGGAEEAPTAVLPTPNAEPVAGGAFGVASTVGPIQPQPLLTEGDIPDGLAAHVEQAIADDGRFDASRIAFTTDGGHVCLSGIVPSETQRRSLVATVRVIPGVSNVEDRLRVE